MSSLSIERTHQGALNVHFEASSDYWTKIYDLQDVDGTIYRQRRSVVLDLVRKLKLPPDSQILEIGCGSGSTSIQLARQGYTVRAVDSVYAMVKGTRKHAEQAGVSERVMASVRDVHDLGYPDESFDLVLKIGVAPWLYSLDRAISEVARVLRPGGYLIATADNWWRLNHWLDLRHLPPLRPIKRQLRNVLERLALIRPGGPSVFLRSIGEFDAYLFEAGLHKIEGRTVGFGPFSFLGFRILSDSTGVRVHRWLQSLADNAVPILRSMGTHYIVLARKDSPHRLKRGGCDHA